ncbi:MULTISPECIES: hypothetical protein [Photorhabdus]|nr:MULTISPECIES: hypothetical protein [Photorhabdus]MCW7549270.1 hypothetical protein [Photorhabdus aballayi]
MYCLELAGFTASEFNCLLSPQECRRPRRLTMELLADTRKKLNKKGEK